MYRRSLCLALAAMTGMALAAQSTTEKNRASLEQALVPPVLVRGEKPVMPALAERMTELNVPGVSIAVIHEGRIEWARGYGVTRAGGPAITPDTLFQAASISKPVFALAALRLVEAGKLDLDASVNAHLKTWKLPDNELTRQAPVTLRRLLTHSAGLTVHGFPGYTASSTLPTTVQVLDGKPPANTGAIRVDILPGSRLRYSGGGYTVAQQLMVDSTGLALPKLMQDTVLIPLGMNRSTYEQPLPAPRLAEVALPHESNGEPVSGGPHVYPEMAAAGLWTTPSDLARYALGVQQALAGDSKLISAQTARAMLEPQLANQGIGPQIGGTTARKFFMHGGANAGYRCLLVAYRDGEGVIVMTNADSGGTLMGEIVRTVAHLYGWPDFGPLEVEQVALEPEQLDRFLGVYELNDGAPLVVRKSGVQLQAGIAGQSFSALSPSSAVSFFARDSAAVVEFTLSADGKVGAATYRHRGWERTGTRMDDARARPLLAELERTAQRIESQTPQPGSEAALRQLLLGLAAGNPDYTRMSAPFADLTRTQLGTLQKFIGDHGALKSLTFVRVGERGGDQYDADFERDSLRVFIVLGADGEISGAGFLPK